MIIISILKYTNVLKVIVCKGKGRWHYHTLTSWTDNDRVLTFDESMWTLAVHGKGTWIIRVQMGHDMGCHIDRILHIWNFETFYITWSSVWYVYWKHFMEGSMSFIVDCILADHQSLMIVTRNVGLNVSNNR